MKILSKAKKIAFEFKVAMMGPFDVRREIVAQARAGDMEKLGYLVRNLKNPGHHLPLALIELAAHGKPPHAILNQALVNFTCAAPAMADAAARILIWGGDAKTAAVIFPRLTQFSKDSLLKGIISCGIEKEAPMAQLLIEHGASLSRAMAELAADCATGRDDAEIKRATARTMAAKLKPQI